MFITSKIASLFIGVVRLLMTSQLCIKIHRRLERGFGDVMKCLITRFPIDYCAART